jgi:hypothetical protein
VIYGLEVAHDAEEPTGAGMLPGWVDQLLITESISGLGRAGMGPGLLPQLMEIFSFCLEPPPR